MHLFLFVFAMFKLKICFLFLLHICYFKLFHCLIALSQPRDTEVIVYDIFVRNTINCLSVGKIHSKFALFIVVVCYTEIFNYTNDKLATQRLLK